MTPIKHSENLGADILEKLTEAEKQHLSDSKKHTHENVIAEMRSIIAGHSTAL